MRLKIRIPSVLEDRFGKIQSVDLPGESVSLKHLIQIISELSWGQELIENGRIRSPYALIVDNQLILLKENPQLSIDEKSDVRFLIFLTGG